MNEKTKKDFEDFLNFQCCTIREMKFYPENFEDVKNHCSVSGDFSDNFNYFQISENQYIEIDTIRDFFAQNQGFKDYTEFYNNIVLQYEIGN